MDIIIVAIVIIVFNILDVDVYWQQTITELILIVVVLADVMRNKNNK